MTLYQWAFHFFGESGPTILIAIWSVAIFAGLAAVALLIDDIYKMIEGE